MAFKLHHLRLSENYQQFLEFILPVQLYAATINNYNLYLRQIEKIAYQNQLKQTFPKRH